MEKNIFAGIKRFGKKCIRVWHVLKKPTKQEFKMTSKVSAIGIALLGILGFAISAIMRLIIRALVKPL